MLMHSLDTVKTRQQGDPHMPPKYTSMGNTYYTIWRQEGFRKGLYGGVQPAFLGSFAGTVCFFDISQVSSPTSLLHPHTFHPKSSRHVCNYKAATTTPTLTQATTTAAPLTLPEQ